MSGSRNAWVLGLGLVLLAGPAIRPAYAIKQFADEFKDVYVKEGSPLSAEVEKAKCNVCHVGKSKKDHNAYGKALAERLDKKEDKENKEKIRKALEEVEALSSDPGKPDAPTFGQLIAAGKLPGGPIAE
jgi:predicted Ser/Thr protein kinase